MSPVNIFLQSCIFSTSNSPIHIKDSFESENWPSIYLFIIFVLLTNDDDKFH